MFGDFSSACNTIQPHLSLKMLLSDFDLNPSLAMWILDFLLERLRRVCVDGCLSYYVCISTGSHQCCVLSPLLLILYTNNCVSTYVRILRSTYVRYLRIYNNITYNIILLAAKFEQDGLSTLKNPQGFSNKQNILPSATLYITL